MISSSGGASTGLPGFRLQTFGTLRLTGSDDETVLGDHGHQRRRLALLAVLAAAGERGRSRDQLLGLFWPEVTQARARHSLDQLLYAIRTSLDGGVFTGANPVRLNSSFVGSDIDDFTVALENGEVETAVDSYRGPFLDGFYLSDAPEFETWMDAERRRIERSYSEALERLAKSAEEAGDFGATARWRQKLVDADPLSSKHAIGLIRALMNAGDHVAALRYAERYEALVAQELGTSVGPAVAGLVAEVRARAKTESLVVREVSQPPEAKAANRSAILPVSLPDAVEPTAPPLTDDEQLSQPFVPATPALGARRRRTLMLYGGVVVALAALFVAVSLLRRGSADDLMAPVAPSSLAVLPLSNLSRDPRDAALVDGLSEELIGVLAKIERLRVVARTSAFVFKNSNLDVRQIADSLHVSNILEGGVQKIGQRLRVQVRLVDARDGSTKWSETYDRDLRDIFLIQSEIAAEVARELNLRLVGPAVDAVRRGPTKNIAAYELHLRGSDPLLLRSDSGALKSLQYFRQAIALDSTFAPGYAGIARMHLRLRPTGLNGMPARSNYEFARQAALKAVSLDDSLAEAHAALGLVRMMAYDFPRAEAEFNRAVALDPGHSRIREWRTFLYYWTERPVEAMAEANRALENDPLSPSAHAEVARGLCANGKAAEGLARLKKLEALRPPLGRTAGYVALCHGASGNWAAGAEALRHTTELSGRALYGHALARAGRRTEAKIVLAEFMDRWKRTNYGAYHLALVHAGLGDNDQAFEWLDRSIYEASLITQFESPLFDQLQSDSRFQQFRRRVGIQNR
ncbi:MAG: BTAD domain-containing putative transcriptional regulator [Gemmatimonadaceae bacterium]